MYHVYALFNVLGDGDSYSDFGLIAISYSINSLITKIESIPIDENRLDLAHESMNKENKYCFIGTREECNPYCTYGRHGGYVIEKIKII